MVEQQTVVIFRLGSLGDSIVALPCFHLVERAFPLARRVVLTNSPVSPKAPSLRAVLGGSNLFHESLDYPPGLGNLRDAVALLMKLRQLKSSTLIYLAPRPRLRDVMRDLAFFRLVGFSKIIGAPLTKDHRLRTDRSTGYVEPEAERLARSIAEIGNVDLADRSFWDLRITREERVKAAELLSSHGANCFLALSAGGKVQSKDWGDQNWDYLIANVSARWPRLGLVLVGSEHERDRLQSLSRRWAGPMINAAGLLSPRETAAVLQKAAAFVGHDLGPMHLAAAVGTICVGVFGEGNAPRRWHPYGRGHRILHNMAGVGFIQPQELTSEVVSVLATQLEGDLDNGGRSQPIVSCSVFGSGGTQVFRQH